MNNNLVYDVHQTPPFWKNLAFALQQVMAIITATMLVPILADATGVYLSQSAALIGAGVGTIIYLLFTKFKSPVFLGSSFAFIMPLTTAVNYGYFGILLGSLFAGLVYVLLAVIIKFAGASWVNKIMPPVVIGPVVALIGFDLATSAIENLVAGAGAGFNWVALLVGIVTFLITVLISVKGHKSIRLFPFILAILFGYALAAVLTVIGELTQVEMLQLIDFSMFEKIGDFSNWLPNLNIVGVFTEGASKMTSFADVLTIFVAFVPIAVVSFAEHIADHKNISSVVGRDLLVDPGLHRSLLGDGFGTIVGALFGGCPNTTYGESIGCVALSRNASTKTILTSSILCVVLAFFYPLVAFVSSIPVCVIGGVCIALYGFISVSGLRMMQGVDFTNTRNLFVASSILITGIGGLELTIGPVVISPLACALVLGIITNLLLMPWTKKNNYVQKPELMESEKTIPEEEKQQEDNEKSEE